MMIAHISLPAADPAHVARVLAEIMEGEATPFPPGGPGSWMAWSRDGEIELEVMPRDGVFIPGVQGAEYTNADAPPLSAAHAAIGIERSAADILSIARREGWRAEDYDRGGFFRVIEVWIENSFMIEFLDPAQTAAYKRSMTPANWKTVFGVQAAA